ncbi:MAG: hypothetical protein PHR20_03845 [Bacteroidales bacterium]|nr:hypothetical protein [Bacteroidales bacterium]
MNAILSTLMYGHIFMRVNNIFAGRSAHNTYIDEGKHKVISLLTNDMNSDPAEIINICRKRWKNIIKSISEVHRQLTLFD